MIKLMKDYSYTNFAAIMTDGKKQHKKWVYVSNTKLIKQILNIMYEANLILSYSFMQDKVIKVYFKHTNNKCNFKALKAISLPSKKKNVDAIGAIKLEKRATSIYIISTQDGLKTHGECLVEKLYGEVIMQIIV